MKSILSSLILSHDELPPLLYRTLKILQLFTSKRDAEHEDEGFNMPQTLGSHFPFSRFFTKRSRRNGLNLQVSASVSAMPERSVISKFQWNMPRWPNGPQAWPFLKGETAPSGILQIKKGGSLKQSL